MQPTEQRPDQWGWGHGNPVLTWAWGQCSGRVSVLSWALRGGWTIKEDSFVSAERARPFIHCPVIPLASWGGS